MSKWFPELDDTEGVKAALMGGVYGTLAFAGMLVLGMVMLYFTGRSPVSGQSGGDVTGALIGIVIELVLVLVAAWRFKTGKGLLWGSAILVLFVFEIFTKVASGTTNVGWIIFYAAVAVGLVNGVRGAWAQKTMSFNDA